MLSVVSGASVAQDIPAYFKELGLDYGYEHRNEPKIQGEYRDFAFHDVVVKDHDSLLYRLMGADVIKDAPSWHHQAVGSVENTRLKVTALLEVGGIEIVEAVERADKSFAVGLQFHPEAAIVKHLEGMENAGQFMDYDTAVKIFEYLVNEETSAMPDAA